MHTMNIENDQLSSNVKYRALEYCACSWLLLEYGNANARHTMQYCQTINFTLNTFLLTHNYF